MVTVLSAAVEAAVLEPPADTVWRSLIADFADAVGDAVETAPAQAAFCAAVEARCHHIARERELGIVDVFTGVRMGFSAFAAALGEASGGEAAVARKRLARLENEALVRAGTGYAKGLEERVELLSAEVDFLRPEDPMTGVMKESEIVRRLGVELDRCRRMDLALGLAQVGVDCLDAVRHHGGPGEPGEFLRRVARLLGDSLRQYDAIGRRGEECFLVVLPDVSRRGLQSVIERFRHDLIDECPAVLHAHFSFSLAHLDYLDLAADEVLAQMDSGLDRARAGGDSIAWI
jgi:diguanylate cyclase (GGDEF)-like protein